MLSANQPPPTRKSNIIDIKSIKEIPVGLYGLHHGNLSVFAVGTYQEEEIGAACYHTNLAIFENILTHTNDKEGYLIADMVAGVDSFAGTLHAQFDLTCLVVEPTMRSIEVYTKYISLANEAGIAESVMVVGNKVRNEKDKEFIKTHIPSEKIIGFFTDDEHVRDIDQDSKKLEASKLNNENQELLKRIFEVLKLQQSNPNKRLKKLWELHKKYVCRPLITERFGDLTNQIDTDFTFN